MEWEQLNKLGSNLDMTFRSFVEHYEEDRRSRIKDSTWESKEHIIRTKLLPYFGKLKMSSITPQQIVRWQNELINYRDKDGAPYSPVYLKSIQNQISADDLDPELAEMKAALAEVLKYSLIIVASLPVLVVYPFVQKYFMKGVMLGSVKG